MNAKISMSPICVEAIIYVIATNKGGRDCWVRA